MVGVFQAGAQDTNRQIVEDTSMVDDVVLLAIKIFRTLSVPAAKSTRLERRDVCLPLRG